MPTPPLSSSSYHLHLRHPITSENTTTVAPPRVRSVYCSPLQKGQPKKGVSLVVSAARAALGLSDQPQIRCVRVGGHRTTSVSFV
ncbi:hypothetical protein Tco_1081229 [Tanacetum coccineum]|uniref:Uncharacterized protein n=1 Tax=Tanacetum coccineum TaxID=301880 RepID=A0ABQ5HYA7_9ASTR